MSERITHKQAKELRHHILGAGAIGLYKERAMEVMAASGAQYDIKSGRVEVTAAARVRRLARLVKYKKESTARAKYYARGAQITELDVMMMLSHEPQGEEEEYSLPWLRDDL